MPRGVKGPERLDEEGDLPWLRPVGGGKDVDEEEGKNENGEDGDGEGGRASFSRSFILLLALSKSLLSLDSLAEDPLGGETGAAAVASPGSSSSESTESSSDSSSPSSVETFALLVEAMAFLLAFFLLSWGDRMIPVPRAAMLALAAAAAARWGGATGRLTAPLDFLPLPLMI